MDRTFSFKDEKIHPGGEPYFIAEMSANHNKDYDTAARIIREVAQAGADAIKVQTFKPDTMTLDCDRPEFRIEGGTEWEGRTLHDLYEEAYLPWEWHADLREEARNVGLDFLSTAYDETALEFLEDLGTPLHKVASFELVDLPLIKKMAQTGKPMIISTGLGTLKEIEEAVHTARKHGCDELLLLHCTSAYPTPVSESNLRTIPHLSEAFDVPVGLSDHTEGIAVPVAAISQGTCLYEKHVCLSRDIDTPDSTFSLEPPEFERMVEETRRAHEALGEINYDVTEHEKDSLIFRRSLFVVTDVEEGEPVTQTNVARIRPGHGLPPRCYSQVLGRTFNEDIEKGTPLSWELLT